MQSTKEHLIELIVFQSATTREKLLTSDTWKEIGIDSLDTLEIMLAVNERFNIEIEEDDEELLTGFSELLEYLERKLNE
jgi:acyl carrier protein